MKAAQQWTNWSGIVACTPAQVVYPTSVEEVVSLVQWCNTTGHRLRVVGSGHSFTPLVQTDDVLVSLDRMSGLVEVDTAARTAVVWAGTKLKRLGELLHRHGLAQENLGDINVQSIAGAISTGTHGTGTAFGTLATQVIGLKVVLGNGTVMDCSEEEHPELFKAMQVSFGALGVIVQVKLRLVPSFRLKYVTGRMKLDDCLRSLDTLCQQNRHFEFYCFPYSDTVQVKFMNETHEPVTQRGWKDYWNKIVMENRLFWVLSEACRLVPALTKPVSRLSAASVPVFEEVAYSHELFATPRLVRFNEMEYNIPAAHMAEVIQEVLACIERERIAVHFPIECRFVRADDIWLSPASGRESGYVAIHMYRGMPHERYFRTVEQIFLRCGGRPHWGKLHYRTAEDFQQMYPMWDEFRRVRLAADPNGVLQNDYLAVLFGGRLDASGDPNAKAAQTAATFERE